MILISLAIAAVAMIAFAVGAAITTYKCAGGLRTTPPNVSLTQSAAYFTEQMREKVLREIGQPIEGFDQDLFIRVYPGLVAQDFIGVETLGRRNPPGVVTSADAAITDYGMATLLENIARRAKLPIVTNSDIDAVLNFIGRTPQDPASGNQETVALEGKFVCLPHRDTSGPQTLECAFGVETDDKTYYALDLSGIGYESSVAAQSAKRMKVEGLLVPIEAISSNQWQKYNIKGIMRVTNMFPFL